MKIKVPHVDGRSRLAEYKTYVLDLDTGETIGYVENRQGWNTITPDGEYKRHPRRRINLFDGAYIGDFETHDECVAFAKGIEAAIARIAPTKALYQSDQKSA